MLPENGGCSIWSRMLVDCANQMCSPETHRAGGRGIYSVGPFHSLDFILWTPYSIQWIQLTKVQHHDEASVRRMNCRRLCNFKFAKIVSQGPLVNDSHEPQVYAGQEHTAYESPCFYLLAARTRRERKPSKNAGHLLVCRRAASESLENVALAYCL